MQIIYNFGIGKDLTIAGSAAGIGGLLYGTSYVQTKKALGEDISKEQANKEIAANSLASLNAGLGGYLISKALQNKVV